MDAADDPSVLFPGVSPVAKVELDQWLAVFQFRYLRPQTWDAVFLLVPPAQANHPDSC